MKTSYKYKFIRNVISEMDENLINFLYTYKDSEYVSIKEILNSDLSIDTKFRLVLRDYGYKKKYENIPQLTLVERKELLYKLCEAILPIYTLLYPSDQRVETCLKAYNDLTLGKISKDEYKVFHKECYNACSESHRQEEFGFGYSVSYAVYAIDRNIGNDSGDGLSEIIDSIKFDKIYEQKALEILTNFFSVEYEIIPEDDIISNDRIIDDILFNTSNSQSDFDNLDEKIKMEILLELVDTIDENPHTQIAKDRNKIIGNFLSDNKKIVKKLKKLIV